MQNRLIVCNRISESQSVTFHCKYCNNFVRILYIVNFLEGLREDCFCQLSVPLNIESLLLLFNIIKYLTFIDNAMNQK